MIVIWLLDPSTGDLWIGMEDGKARTIPILPAAADQAGEDSARSSSRPLALVGPGLGRGGGNGEGRGGSH